MRNIVCILLALILIFSFSACGKRIKEMKKAAEELKEMGERIEETARDFDKDDPDAVKKQMEDLISGGKNVEPVDYAELKGFMPEKLDQFERTDISGEKVEIMGAMISEAEASYGSDSGNERIKIKISDIGDMSGVVLMASFAWAMSDFSRETDDGYEKTTSYKDYKAFEEYNTSSSYGKMSVIVADRFVVNVDGHNTEMKEIKSALDKIDLKKLESMKDHGVEL